MPMPPPRALAGVMDTSSAWLRPPGVEGACGSGTMRRWRMVLPKNCSSTRTAVMLSPPSDSLRADSRAAPRLRALRMRLALPWLTDRPRLLDGSRGSTTLRYLGTMGRRCCCICAREIPGPTPTPWRMMASLPYLSRTRHRNSGVSSRPSRSWAWAGVWSAGAGPGPAACTLSSRSSGTAPWMLTAFLSHSNSAKNVRNLCSTSRGVDSSLWNTLRMYSTRVSSA
mmetsp:Transcript_27617/g.67953  ORF Transcript_27617/g.67953 Transcript_27617/m.67953 type:complete len:225 (+) Transcript_27617:155-829(+)